METIRIPINNTYFPVHRFGNGKEVFVMIAGISLCGLEESGSAIAAAYQAIAEKYTVYVFDRCKVLPQGCTVFDLARDVYEAMRQLNITNAHIMGVSHGGMIAQSFAFAYPEMVKSLLLVSTTQKPTEESIGVLSDWLSFSDQYDVVSLNRSFFERVYTDSYYQKYRSAFDDSVSLGSKEDCKRFSVLCRSAMDFDGTAYADTIACPVLVVCGEEDRIFSPLSGKNLALSLRGEYKVFPSYGHAVYDECPEFKSLILQFIESVDYDN